MRLSKEREEYLRRNQDVSPVIMEFLEEIDALREEKAQLIQRALDEIKESEQNYSLGYRDGINVRNNSKILIAITSAPCHKESV